MLDILRGGGVVLNGVVLLVVLLVVVEAVKCIENKDRATEQRRPLV